MADIAARYAPYGGRQSVSLGGHPKSRRTPGTWRISPPDISPAGANPDARRRDGKFFDSAVTPPGAPSIGARTPYRRPLPTSGVTHEKISLASSVVGAALLGVASVGAHAAQNPFAVQELSSGYSVAAAEKAGRFLRRGQVRGADKGKREASKAAMKAAAVRIARPRKVPAVARRRPAKATAAPTRRSRKA